MSNPQPTQDLFARPLDLSQLLSVQNQAIVSRILVKHPSGSITLFAFDAGQSVEEHTAPFDAMIHVLEGEAEVSIAGEWHLVSSGQAILLPANVPHAVRAPKAFKMVLVMLRRPSQ
ncbi:cupin domain-containing protein [Thermogutta sp.]|jgi:quercetin dioxygenase-like cupin family protein|uniref:cupin domain-containing protein n=1 Tax=Thermogutta sp. TaxID=1962930 RepID=UPI0032205CD9